MANCHPALAGARPEVFWLDVPDRPGRLRARLHRPRGRCDRFGADVALDLVDGLVTERTQLRMARERPLPFPPEPLRHAVIQLTRRSLASSDANDGRRNLWLRSLDRLGLGFDS